MNFKPAGANVMHYCNPKWDNDVGWGKMEKALLSDFGNRDVKKLRMNFIAIVRHNGYQSVEI